MLVRSPLEPSHWTKQEDKKMKANRKIEIHQERDLNVAVSLSLLFSENALTVNIILQVSFVAKCFLLSKYNI